MGYLLVSPHVVSAQSILSQRILQIIVVENNVGTMLSI